MASNGCLHNAVALIADGTVDLRFKHELPNYGVFDEKRVFAPGPLPTPVDFRGARSGCRSAKTSGSQASRDTWPHAGAQLLLVPNGSPFEVDKFASGSSWRATRATEIGLPLAYVNQVGRTG